MTILGVRAALFRPCAAGARGGAGRAGTAGELLGAHDVAVAWICRQRLEPPAGWTWRLLIRIFFTEIPSAWWLPASGAAPVRSGCRMSGYGW